MVYCLNFNQSTLLTLHKTFIRYQLGYADIIYNQIYNSSFHDKLESISYNACLEIAGVKRGNSTEKLDQEVGVGSLKSRSCFRNLCYFNLIFIEKCPLYLFDLATNLNRVHNTRHGNIRLALTQLEN